MNFYLSLALTRISYACGPRSSLVPFTIGRPAVRTTKAKVLQQSRHEVSIRQHFSSAENRNIAPIVSFTIGERNVAKLARSNNSFAVARVRYKHFVGMKLISRDYLAPWVELLLCMTPWILRKAKCKPAAYAAPVPGITARLLPGHNARDPVGIVRQGVAAPGDMQVRPDEDIIAFIDAADGLAVDSEQG